MFVLYFVYICFMNIICLRCFLNITYIRNYFNVIRRAQNFKR